MRKLLLPLISLIFLGFFNLSFANKSYIEIGEGTIDTNNPLYTSWSYAWCNLLYTSDDLGEAKTITKIAFYVSKDMGGYQLPTITDQKLYINHTSESNAEEIYPDPDNSGYSLVWEGDIIYPANGPQWLVIDIDDFEYNGTDNLSLHWQNHSGLSNVSGVGFLATSVENATRVCGGDGGFPYNGTSYASYQHALPNLRIYFASEGPQTPEAVLPLNNAIKVNVDNEFTFELADATSYDFYLAKEGDALVKVASDIAVNGDGTYSYTHTNLLESKTTYVWKVVAKDGTNETTSPEFKFQTQKFVTEFPFECGFEEFWITNLGDTLNAIINTNYPDSSDWTYDSDWSANKSPLNVYNGDFAAKVSAWNPGDISLKTPRMNIEGTSQVSFYWRNNYFFDNKKSEKAFVTTYFEVTTDGGVTWNELDALTPESAMTDYQYQSYDLANYTGTNVYFRWRFNEVNESNAEYFWLDNIKVSQVVAGGEIEIDVESFVYPEVCTGGESSFNVTVRNTGSQDLVITGGTSEGPFETDYSGTIVSGGQEIVKVYFRPLEPGDYNAEFMFTSNAVGGDATISVSGSSYAPLTDFYEGFDASDELPDKWNKIKSEWDLYSDVSINNDYFSAPHCAKLIKLNDSISPIMLITPGVTGFESNVLSFMAKKNYGAYYNMVIEVGVISNPADPSTFVAQETIELTDEYASYSVTFKPDNTVPYIAFKHALESPLTSFRVDDISWEAETVSPPNAADIVYPASNASQVDIMNNVVLKWANGGGGTTGYKINFGTNNPPSDIISNEELSLDQMSFAIEAALTYNTTYYWQVVPFNQYGDCEDAPVWSFTSMEDPTTTVPFSENFNSLINTDAKDHPIGWSIEDIHGDNNTWDVLMNNPSFPSYVLGEAAMHMPFHPMNPKDDYLYTPPITMQAGKTYELSFMLHTEMDPVLGIFFNEEIEVLIGTDNSSEAMSDEEIVYANIDHDTWTEIKATFTVETDDDYYLGFHGISEAFFYLLIIDDVKITEVVSVNDAPVFTSVPADSVKIDEAYIYNVVVTDANADAVSISASEMPDWLSLTDNGDGTAVLTGSTNASGGYNVRLVASDGTDETAQNFVVKVYDGVGLVESLSGLITVYPNPAKDFIKISVADNIVLESVIIIDVDGRIVKQTNDIHKKVNVNGLNPGFYYLVIFTDKGKVKQKMVIE